MKNLIEKYVSASDDVHFGQEKRWSARIPIIIYDYFFSLFLLFFLLINFASINIGSSSMFGGICLFMIVVPVIGCIPMMFRVPGRNPLVDDYFEQRYILIPLLIWVCSPPAIIHFVKRDGGFRFMNFFDIGFYILLCIVTIATIIKVTSKGAKDEKAWNSVRYQMFPSCIAFLLYMAFRFVG